MYLVDTSVWIDYLRGRGTAHVLFLDELLQNPLAVGLSDLIYMEVLQGARDVRNFDRLRDYFGGQRFYRFEEPVTSHAAAARIYYDCRRRGITVRSTLDCLIARCAIENALILLHHDQYFVQMAKALPDLRQKHFLA